MVRIELEQDVYESLLKSGLLNISNHEMKFIDPDQNKEFQDDEHWKELRKASIKALDKLKAYEYEKRHKQ